MALASICMEIGLTRRKFPTKTTRSPHSHAKALLQHACTLLRRLQHHRWARGGKGGNGAGGGGGGGGGVGGSMPPPDVQKSAPPQTNNSFTTVPPSNWLAAVGSRKNEKKNYQNCQTFAAFRWLSPFVSSFCLLFPPLSPLRKAELVPPPGVPKTTPPPAKIWLIPLPVVDPTPTYMQHTGTLHPPLFSLHLFPVQFCVCLCLSPAHIHHEFEGALLPESLFYSLCLICSMEIFPFSKVLSLKNCLILLG